MGVVGSGAVSGYGSMLGLAQEVTSGTILTATAFMPFISESMSGTTEKKVSEELVGTRNPLTILTGPTKVEGSIEIHARVDQDFTCFLLKHAMGGTVSSTRPIALGSYQHTFNLGDTFLNDSTVTASDLPSLSVFKRAGSTTSFTWAYGGCKVNQLTIKGEMGKPISINAQLVGMNYTLTTIAYTTFTFTGLDLSPLMFNGVSIKEAATSTAWAAGTISAYQSFEFSINNNMQTDDKARQLGSRNLAIIPPGPRQISLKLSERFDTTTAYSKALANTLSAIQIACVGDVTASAQAGDTVYSMVIQIPGCYWESGKEPKVSDKGIITVEETAIVVQPQTTTALCCQIIVDNATTGY